jgi:hypothetical protein
LALKVVAGQGPFVFPAGRCSFGQDCPPCWKENVTALRGFMLQFSSNHTFFVMIKEYFLYPVSSITSLR